jgi:hypothetical protein
MRAADRLTGVELNLASSRPDRRTAMRSTDVLHSLSNWTVNTSCTTELGHVYIACANWELKTILYMGVCRWYGDKYFRHWLFLYACMHAYSVQIGRPCTWHCRITTDFLITDLITNASIVSLCSLLSRLNVNAVCGCHGFRTSLAVVRCLPDGRMCM